MDKPILDPGVSEILTIAETASLQLQPAGNPGDNYKWKDVAIAGWKEIFGGIAIIRNDSFTAFNAAITIRQGVSGLEQHTGVGAIYPLAAITIITFPLLGPTDFNFKLPVTGTWINFEIINYSSAVIDVTFGAYCRGR